MTGNAEKRATLVVGGTGKTGRRVVERLRARDLPVLVGSRSGAPPFDWDDPGMWAAALRGADCVYVTYYPDLAFPGASAEAAGRDIAYVPVSAQEYAAALAEHMPSDEALLLTDLFAGVLDGRNAHLSRGVRRALGRLPRDFADFAADTAASGVWEA